ncbi:hypothetical protein NL676_019845 [Syzygium grande]|nr:hypothetical protein NL676_019845 [Syzygium grande]
MNKVVESPGFCALCAFRTSIETVVVQIREWPESVLEKLDSAFLGAPCPSAGKSGLGGIFDPPYFECFLFQVHQVRGRVSRLSRSD